MCVEADSDKPNLAPRLNLDEPVHLSDHKALRLDAAIPVREISAKAIAKVKDKFDATVRENSFAGSVAN
jgi:hypothetical protein